MKNPWLCGLSLCLFILSLCATGCDGLIVDREALAIELASELYEECGRIYASFMAVGKVPEILDRGANPNYDFGEDKYSPFNRAVMRTRVGMVRVMLERGAKQIPHHDGNSPLSLAANFSMNEKMIEVLLEHGADVNYVNLNDGRTALHHTTYTMRYHHAKALLEHGANVNARDFKGMTPLGLTASQRHSQLAALLQQYGGTE